MIGRALGAWGLNARRAAPSQDMPFRVLQHDWRFWVSVLGGFSLLMFAERVDEALARARQAALNRCAPKPSAAALI